VRVIAASNIDVTQAIENGKFREDLYYRLNTVPIKMPPLRDRGDDIILLFRKFAADFADKYRMPPIRLTKDAQSILLNYNWPGNVRQLKNITEQISIIESEREIGIETLRTYIPDYFGVKLPALLRKNEEKSFSSEREILYKILFDMKSDMSDLKKLVLDLIRKGGRDIDLGEDNNRVIRNLFGETKVESDITTVPEKTVVEFAPRTSRDDIQDTEEIFEESLSLSDKEVELIRKALEKHNHKRKLAARELGISERTLYRKIKEYGIGI
jgi:DNA-binding NtrC family response regulator